MQNHWVSSDSRVLDSPFMESGSPEYESVRQHYLFSGLDQEDFDALMQKVSRVTLEKGEALALPKQIETGAGPVTVFDPGRDLHWRVV